VHSHLLDRYRDGSSLLHRLDPRLKLVAVLSFVVVASTLDPRAARAFLVLGLVLLALWLLAQIPPVEMLRYSLLILPFAGVTAIALPFTQDGNVLWRRTLWGVHLALTDRGLALFLAVLVKSWLSVLASGLLVMTTPFPTLLSALCALGVPRVLTAIISFAFRYLFVLVEEARRLQTAREARSAGSGGTLLWRVRVLGGMVGSLFIRSYERSERIYAAMLSRGYDGQMHTLNALQWCRQDSWAAVLWGGTMILVLLIGWKGL
jgi:cobalt/nickel transport system permease protein